MQPMWGLSKNASNSFRLDRNHWDYQAGFDASWELDFWGKFRRDVEAAQASLIASVADYDDALVSLTAEVARTYTVIRTFEVLIDLARENAKLQEEGLRIAESRFRNGATSELDVTQATTLLESTRATIPQLQASLQQSQNAMSTLLGQPTGDVQTLLDGPKGNSGGACGSGRQRTGRTAAAASGYPQCRAYCRCTVCPHRHCQSGSLSELFACSAISGFKAANKAGLQSGDATFHNLFDGDSFFYSFGPGFQWPIFNFGRIENIVRVQDARFPAIDCQLPGYRAQGGPGSGRFDDWFSQSTGSHSV